jgi:hypothetical protein
MKKFGFAGTSKVGLGVALGLALGAAGGAGAVSLTRPSVEMAPIVATPVAKLASSSGVVTVKGRVAEVYGDRFVVQDGTGRTMVDAGRDAAPTKGAAVQVQGRYDDGQLRASYLVDPAGKVTPVGGPRHGPGGPGGPEGRGPGGPGPEGRGPGGPGRPGPRADAGAPCAPGAVPPPPPAAGAVPPAPNGAVPPAQAPVPAPVAR